MNDKSSTEPETALDRSAGSKPDSNDNDKAPSDFVTGLVTFVIFLIFMTAWMYFSSE